LHAHHRSKHDGISKHHRVVGQHQGKIDANERPWTDRNHQAGEAGNIKRQVHNRIGAQSVQTPRANDKHHVCYVGE
jgi:hypothetical protein